MIGGALGGVIDATLFGERDEAVSKESPTAPQMAVTASASSD